MCSCPQAGQSIRPATFGNLRNTLGSTSIAVDTDSRVIGHLIMTVLMADPLRLIPPGSIEWNFIVMEPADRVRLKTARALVDKV